MGSKISIDSATMMNKGLEVIEAHHLFQVPYSKIEVIVHPQSIIHSMVAFDDGTLLSQMSLPDMRLPIQAVLTYPKRCNNPWPKTELATLPPLTFQKPDTNQFPLLKLAYECGEKGGIYPAVMNAANEAIVSQFLNGDIQFEHIFDKVTQVVEQCVQVDSPSIHEILAIDKEIKDRLCPKNLTYV